MKLEDKLGRFARYAENLAFTDEAGNPALVIEAGVTVVSGPFKLVTKDQIARVVGLVTASMTNASNDKGNDVYEFQGNGWRPQAMVGDVLLCDAGNPADRWACKPELFGGTGWVGTVNQDGSVTYAKAGKPQLALEVPEGTPVKSLEGVRLAPAGCLLTMTKADKGDFFLLTADVVQKYVRTYVEVE